MLHHRAGLKLISAQPWDSFLVHGHMLPASSLCKQRDLGFYSSRCHVQKRCTRFPTTSAQLSTIKPCPLKAGTPSLMFVQAPSCVARSYLRPPLGSSSEEKAPLQTFPKEWLGFSLASSQSEAGSLFFRLPKSFLKGWNLPAFFLSVDYKANTGRAEGSGPRRDSPALTAVPRSKGE